MCQSEKTFSDRVKQKVTKKEWIRRQREANSQKQRTVTVDRHTLSIYNPYRLNRESSEGNKRVARVAKVARVGQRVHIIFAVITSSVGKLLCVFWIRKPHFNKFLPITALFLSLLYSSNYLCQTMNRYKTLPDFKLESGAWKSQNI